MKKQEGKFIKSVPSNKLIAMDVSKTDTIVAGSVSSTTNNVKKKGIND